LLPLASKIGAALQLLVTKIMWWGNKILSG